MSNSFPPPAARSRRSVLGLLGAAPVAAGGVLTASGSVTAAEARPASIARDLRPGGRFDRFVAELAERDQFSGTVLLAHQGRTALTRSYGMANKDRSVPNRENTRFNLASITKCFTAVAIARLAQQGEVAFHEKLGTYLDGFRPELADTVTVHQLLTHTAGVGRPGLTHEKPEDADDWDSTEEIWDGTMAFLRARPAEFTPGTRYGYSNDGYFVLGAIVAAVSGLTYYDYVRQHVFAPAGMGDTGFYTKPQVLADNTISRPYATQPGGGRIDATTTKHFAFIGDPANGAYSTARDLLRFSTALHDGRLLNRAYTRLVTSGKTVVAPSAVSGPVGDCQLYGYGQIETVTGEHRVVWHSGSAPGQANNLDVHPDQDWVAIVLSNYDNSVRPIVELERQLIQC